MIQELFLFFTTKYGVVIESPGPATWVWILLSDPGQDL